MRHQYIALLLVLLTPMFLACLWDNDTIQMERRAFPDTLELITGKFLRHSDVYYQWRIEDRKPRLAASPTPELFDDLAVAFEKLGDHDKAIELMHEKQAAFPGLYETHANLGTFLIHAGRLEEGIKEIEKAIEINPDAHFGREIYQLQLVKFILENRKDGQLKLPLDPRPLDAMLAERTGFAKFLNAASPEFHETKNVDHKAVKGVLGMMRFGNFDSPILLESLGDLLRQSTNSNMLAARAYLKASYEVDDITSREHYRSKARASYAVQDDRSFAPLEKLEHDFRSEIKEADEWFAKIVADEKRWAEQGLNLDEEFSKVYYKEPRINQPLKHNRGNTRKMLYLTATLIGVMVAIVAFACGRKLVSDRK